MPSRHRVRILPDDIDHMGHVNNSVYLKWVQDAVLGYWHGMAPADVVRRHLWVALRHDITYRRPAFLGDRIEAMVFAEGVEGCRATFRTLIKRGEEVLAEVKSCWCCLDAVNHRPTRPAREIVRKFLLDR